MSAYTSTCEYHDHRDEARERRGVRRSTALLAPSTHMNYPAALERKRHELLAAIMQRDDLRVEVIGDQHERSELQIARETAARRLTGQTETLRQVEAALERVRCGEFGLCVRCEDAISPLRLAAVPWAERCKVCQEAVERMAAEGAQQHA